MRSINELLVILREYTDANILHTGLCLNVNRIVGPINVKGDEWSISTGEAAKLINYINIHLPLYYNNGSRNPAYPYAFKKGNKRPRLKWLDEHIQLTIPKFTSCI